MRERSSSTTSLRGKSRFGERLGHLDYQGVIARDSLKSRNSKAGKRGMVWRNTKMSALWAAVCVSLGAGPERERTHTPQALKPNRIVFNLVFLFPSQEYRKKNETIFTTEKNKWKKF